VRELVYDISANAFQRTEFVGNEFGRRFVKEVLRSAEAREKVAELKPQSHVQSSAVSVQVFAPSEPGAEGRRFGGFGMKAVVQVCQCFNGR
jgi:hypothetical protein